MGSIVLTANAIMTLHEKIIFNWQCLQKKFVSFLALHRVVQFRISLGAAFHILIASLKK